jgi:hypothetical protein
MSSKPTHTAVPSDNAKSSNYVAAFDFHVSGKDFTAGDSWIRPEGYTRTDEQLEADGYIKKA